MPLLLVAMFLFLSGSVLTVPGALCSVPPAVGHASVFASRGPDQSHRLWTGPVLITEGYSISTSNKCHASSNRCLTSSNKEAVRIKFKVASCYY